jgi:transcriptional regulator with XRE-family HTH domain
MKLGNAIRVVRTAAGMRQRAVAKKLGVSPNYISLIERGKREPSISLLNRLAHVLEVPVGVFFLWQDADKEAIASGKLDRIRELLVRLEAMYLLSRKRRPERRRSAA